MTHPRIGQHLSAITEQLWYSTDPGDNRQEVRVPRPTRDDVLVQVRSNPSATGCTLVNAHVKPLWTGYLLKRADGILGEPGHLDNFLLSRVDISLSLIHI